MASGANLLKVLFNVKPLGNGLYNGERLWRTNPISIYGGELVAQALLSAYETVDKEYTLHCLHSHFIKRADYKLPTTYAVETLNAGATFQSRMVRVMQKGDVNFLMSASFKRDEPSSMELNRSFHQCDNLKDVPRPNELPTVHELLLEAMKMPNLTPAQRKECQVNLQWCDVFPCELKPCDHAVVLRLQDAPDARLLLWIRIRDCPEEVDSVHRQACLVYMPDAFMLRPLFTMDRKFRVGVIASLDYVFWFHGLRHYHPKDWILCEVVTQRAGNALTLNIARIFLEDGTHIATVSQEGFFRQMDPKKHSINFAEGKTEQ